MPEQDLGVVKTPPTEGVVPDEVIERQVAERRAKREELEAEGGDAPAGRELISKAAKGQKLPDEEIFSATEWFLSDEAEDFTHFIQINVGRPDNEKWIEWEIAPVDLDTLKKIREGAQGKNPRQRRRAQATGEIDEVEVNLRIVVEGTVTPDLTQLAHDRRLTDPAELLRRKFGHKPGLLGQISGEIMSISGYDDEDVREAVDAAKNS